MLGGWPLRSSDSSIEEEIGQINIVIRKASEIDSSGEEYLRDFGSYIEEDLRDRCLVKDRRDRPTPGNISSTNKEVFLSGEEDRKGLPTLVLRKKSGSIASTKIYLRFLLSIVEYLVDLREVDLNIEEASMFNEWGRPQVCKIC